MTCAQPPLSVHYSSLYISIVMLNFNNMHDSFNEIHYLFIFLPTYRPYLRFLSVQETCNQFGMASLVHCYPQLTVFSSEAQYQLAYKAFG